MPHYSGNCHCKAINFSFDSPEISTSIVCNCSLCRRKGAFMSTFTLAPEELAIKGNEALSLYQFGSNIAKHYFCSHCGIYTFHQTKSEPGRYRINLGCIDQLDLQQLSIKHFNGATLL